MLLRYIAPALIWALVIIVLTLNPWIPSLPVGPFSFSGIDLLAHLVFLGVQSFLLCRAFEKQVQFPLYKKYYGSLAMTYTSLFGIFIEFVQYYIPTRYFEFFDIVADILGSILGYVIYRWINSMGWMR